MAPLGTQHKGEREPRACVLSRSLECVWDGLVEVCVGPLPADLLVHPAQPLGDLPHVGVHGELSTLHVAHVGGLRFTARTSS